MPGGPRPPPAGVGASSEVSRGHLFKNRVVEGLVRPQLLEPRVLPLELLEPLGLVEAQATVLFPPPVVGLLANPQLLTDQGTRRPRLSSTSACRSLLTICSVLYRFVGIPPPPSARDPNPGSGPV